MIYIFSNAVMQTPWRGGRPATMTTPNLSVRTLIQARGPLARALYAAALCCACWLACAANARAQADAGRAPVPLVEIGPRGELRLDGKPAGTYRRTAALAKRLAAVFRRREREAADDGPARAVIVMAHHAAGYDVIGRVVAAAEKAGADPVRLVSNAGELEDARRELDPKDSALIVVVGPGKDVYVGRRLVSLDELEATVRSLTGGLPEADRAVYIRSHLDAPYKLVVDVIDRVRMAGVKRIALVADKRARE
jgi:biopolymer transport protein ExbD